MDSSRAIFSFLGWTFLPSTVTRFAQEAYYGFTIRAGARRPQPGSPQWIKHNRRIYAMLVVVYLLLTIFDAYDQIHKQGDLYQVLGVDHDASEKNIKSRFRKLAALYHPDKITSVPTRAASQQQFVHLKLAQDTLLNPTRRFAYDRFGPDMLSWEHCVSIKEYILFGIRAYATSYAATGLIMVLLGAMGYLNWGKFWRYTSAVAMILLEVYTLTRPYKPLFLVNFINPAITLIPSQPALLQFQMLALARKITLSISIALLQLGPLFQATQSIDHSSVDGARLARLEQITKNNEIEATGLIKTEMVPFVGREELLKELKDAIQKWLVQNTIRADPAVQEVVGNPRPRKGNDVQVDVPYT